MQLNNQCSWCVCPMYQPLAHLPQCRIYPSVNCASIGSDNGLSPVWRQAIIYTSACLLSIGPLGTNLSEILIKTPKFSFTKMHLNISSAKWWPFFPGGYKLMCELMVPFIQPSLLSLYGCELCLPFSTLPWCMKWKGGGWLRIWQNATKHC